MKHADLIVCREGDTVPQRALPSRGFRRTMTLLHSPGQTEGLTRRTEGTARVSQAVFSDKIAVCGADTVTETAMCGS